MTISRYAIPLATVLATALALAVLRRAARWRREALLFAGVPLLVIVLGIGTSVLMAPSLTVRNVLICSPFLWALAALAYDEGVERTKGWRPVLVAIAAAAVALSASRVAWRLAPHNPPFRESARWIAAQAACQGRTIPVVINALAPMKRGMIQGRARADYGYYLPGYDLLPVFKENILQGASVPDSGCPVAAWGAHYIAGTAEAEQVASHLSRPDHPVRMLAFKVPRDPHGYSSAFVFLRD
jgi:hypothetical protein